jgi:nucleoside-diphosphate-sugar epimerase
MSKASERTRSTLFGTALIVGAERYPGRCAVRVLLERSALHLILGVSSPREVDSLRAFLLRHDADLSRVSWCQVDLSAPEPFVPALPASLGHVLHCGLLRGCRVERERARRVNVEGTRHLLAHCAKLSELRRVLLVSSVYASGLAEGRIPEMLYDGRDGFANHLEWSLAAAEMLALRDFPQLPVSVVRLPIVLADDASGRVEQRDVIHELLGLCRSGSLPLLPGAAETPMHMIDGDLVREAFLRLLQDDCAAGGVYHVIQGPERAPSLLRVLECTYDVLEGQLGRSSGRPMLVSRENLERLASGDHWVLSPREQRLFSCLIPFARQLYVSKWLDNTGLRNLLPNYAMPDPEAQLCTMFSRMLGARRP